jgi:hypothetical protein
MIRVRKCEDLLDLCEKERSQAKRERDNNQNGLEVYVFDENTPFFSDRNNILEFRNLNSGLMDRCVDLLVELKDQAQTPELAAQLTSELIRRAEGNGLVSVNLINALLDGSDPALLQTREEIREWITLRSWNDDCVSDLHYILTLSTLEN